MLHVQQSRPDHTVSVLLRDDDVLRIGSQTLRVTMSPPEEVQVNSSIPNQQSTPEKARERANNHVELRNAIVSNELVHVSRSMREDDNIISNSGPVPAKGKLVEETPAKRTSYRDALDSQVIEPMEVDKPFHTPESETRSVNNLTTSAAGCSIRIEDESQILDNYYSSPPMGHAGIEIEKQFPDMDENQQMVPSPPNHLADVLDFRKIDSMPNCGAPFGLSGSLGIPTAQLESRKSGARRPASEQYYVNVDQPYPGEVHLRAGIRTSQMQQIADKVADSLSTIINDVPRARLDLDQVTTEMVMLSPKLNGEDYIEHADENELLLTGSFQCRVQEAVGNTENDVPFAHTSSANNMPGKARKGQARMNLKSRVSHIPESSSASATNSSRKRKFSTTQNAPSIDLPEKKKKKIKKNNYDTSQDDENSTITANSMQSRLHDGISVRIQSTVKPMSTSTPNSPASIKRKVGRFSASTVYKAYTGSKPRAVFSNSTIPNQPQIMRFFSTQGGKAVNQITENGYDILVVGDNQLKKTSKLLLSVALGKPIVTDAWITQSLKAGKLIDTDPFVPDDPEREKGWGFDLRGATKRNNRRSLFSGKTVFFTPALRKDYGSSFKEIAGLMKVAGADHVISKPPREMDESDGPNIIAVGLEHGDLDAVDLLEQKRRCFNKDLLSLSILRGKLDLESNEFRIVLSGSQQKKKQRKNG